MPVLHFTSRSVQAITPPPKGRIDYWDQVMGGSFGVRVSYTGLKSWVLMYNFKGRKKRHTIGKVRDIPLAQARSRARELLNQISKGGDPNQAKAAERVAETFEELGAEYIEKHAKINKRTWQEDQRKLDIDIYPLWKNKKAKEINRRDVLHLLDTIVQRGAPVHANRVLALIRKIFNFGISRDIVEFNPCQAITRPTDEKPRQGQRVLTINELQRLWTTIEMQRPLVAGIFKLRLLTAQRGSEVRSMQWCEIDFDTNWWTIPGEKTKNKLPHRVPLCAESLEVLRHIRKLDINSPYVFPSPRDKKTHIDNIQKAVQKLRRESAVQFVERDFRRTAASYLTGHLKFPRLTVSKILNHVEAGITKVYDRHSYDDEKVIALTSWGCFLDKACKHDSSTTEQQTTPLRLHLISQSPTKRIKLNQ